MEYLGLAFWMLNGAVSVYQIFRCSAMRNAYGVSALRSPGGWIWIWQAVGVGLVGLFGGNSWHLLWWFPLGFIVCATLGKALYAFGVLRLGRGR